MYELCFLTKLGLFCTKCAPRLREACAFASSPSASVFWPLALFGASRFLKPRVTEKQTIVDTFNSDTSINLCLLSARAGRQVLNLTGADMVLIHDMDFNPHNDCQAKGRYHRIRQTKHVTYRCISSSFPEVLMSCQLLPIWLWTCQLRSACKTGKIARNLEVCSFDPRKWKP